MNTKIHSIVLKKKKNKKIKICICSVFKKLSFSTLLLMEEIKWQPVVLFFFLWSFNKNNQKPDVVILYHHTVLIVRALLVRCWCFLFHKGFWCQSRMASLSKWDVSTCVCVYIICMCFKTHAVCFCIGMT